MGEPKWTPGPWQVCNTYHAVHGERVRNIALCGNAHIPQGNGRILVPDDEAKANAHLIAAAPDLYEACKKARNVLALIETFDELIRTPRRRFEEAIDAIDLALLKARGEVGAQRAGAAS